jgi:peptidoglycan-associated lipoprotein
MNARFLRLAGLSFVLSTMMLLGACHKKSAPVAPPQAPPPAPAKPTATLTVSPTNVQRGGSVQITWSTQDATDVNIDPIGVVPASGTRTLIPRASTTYALTAKGPGGSVQETARVTVTEPPPPLMEEPTAQREAEMFAHSIKDIYFNYDKYDVRPEDAATLKADAEFLTAHSNYKVVISGHCDERGSADYNLALGSSRANAVRDELVKLGVSGDRIKTISYGKEKPFCTEENEKCWQQNRRAHFTLGQ